MLVSELTAIYQRNFSIATHTRRDRSNDEMLALRYISRGTYKRYAESVVASFVVPLSIILKIITIFLY